MSALGELHDMATSHHRATSATPFKMSANYYLVIARYINQAQHLPDRHKVMFTSTGLSGTEWELLCLEMMPENIPWIMGEWRDDLETIRELSQKLPTVSEVSTQYTERDEIIATLDMVPSLVNDGKLAAAIRSQQEVLQYLISKG
jgi:hypothetical protein